MPRAIDRFLHACDRLGIRAAVTRHPSGARTAAEAAAANGCTVDEIVKSLLFVADGDPVLALVSGAKSVDLDVLAATVGADSVRLATTDEVVRATGWEPGAVPPFGHEGTSGAPLPTVLDEHLLVHETVRASAGAVDATFAIEPWRLALGAGATVGRVCADRPGITPTSVRVADEVLEDLRERLDRTRWPPGLRDAGWDEGIDLGYLRDLCHHWRQDYDWRVAEAELNAWPQFVTVIDAQRIHFLHVRSPHDGALPLVIHHGWPGSIAEFLQILGPLTDPTAHGGDAADAFHVVCPSLPGYGFSGPTLERSWTPDRMARAAAVLMERLGYDRYGAQGGDWGAMITSQLGLAAPHRVVGIHLNMVIAPPPRDGDPTEGLTPDEVEDLAAMRTRGRSERGYQEIQGTRPQSLSVGLNDSPAGLAAWIVEKFRAWGDCADGDIESRFTRDQLLTDVTIYWVTNTVLSANRLYFETRRAGRGASVPSERVPVPMGYARFPADGFVPPRAWVERLYDVKRWTVMPRGGHFAAMEEPGLLVDDIQAFFRDLR